MMEKKHLNNEHSIYDAAFSQKGSLKMHIESVHEAKKPFLCNDCVLILSVHEGKEPFVRNDCGKTFSQPQNLNLHIESVHEGRKPF